MTRWVQGLAFAVGLAVASPVLAAPTFPALSGRVVDQAEILAPDVEAGLTSKLMALQAANTDQFVVVTVKSLEGYDIQDYGVQLGRAWGIGQKGKDNGLILLVAPNEKKVGFEVGYGLEGTMTDALTQVIIQSAILPRFRAGDFSGGIQRGVDDAIQVLSGDATEIQQLADKRPADQGTWGIPIPLLIFIVFIIITVMRSRGRRGGRGGLLGAIIASSILNSRSSSGGGSSWGGSSGGGGFSGGGGSFGGGGSSGSW